METLNNDIYFIIINILDNKSFLSFRAINLCFYNYSACKNINKRIYKICEHNLGNLSNSYGFKKDNIYFDISTTKNLSYRNYYPKYLHVPFAEKVVKLTICNNNEISSNELKQLTNLTYLDMSIHCPTMDQKLRIKNKDLIKLTKLETLIIISNNNVDNNTIKALSNLKNLNIKENDIITYKAISQLTKLKILTFTNYNKINNDDIKNLTNLQSINIDNSIFL